MSEQKNTNTYKIATGILAALLVILAIYTVNLYNDNKSAIGGLELQKSEIEAELEEILGNYDTVIQENELKDEQLLQARERIEVLLDSIKQTQVNANLIKRYRAEIGRLKEERTMLFKRADSLMAVNEQLIQEVDSTNAALDASIIRGDSISVANLELEETVKKGSAVGAIDLRGEGVIIRNSGKIVDTRRARRADKIRACFTLTPNPIAEVGDRLLYVQVINPQNNLLGEKASVEFDEGVLSYSTTVTVYYEQEELDVCALVDAEEDDLVKGRYIINVFDGGKQISTAYMELK